MFAYRNLCVSARIMKSNVLFVLAVVTITSLVMGGIFLPLTKGFADIKRGTEVIDGTSVADTIHGNGGRDVIHGFQDDDVIYGEGGNDLLFGNSGGDTLYGGSGNDVLSGDIGGPLRGSDKFYCGTGKDTVLDFEPSEGDYQSGCEIFHQN